MRSLLPEDVPVEYTIDNGEVVVTAVPAQPALVGKRALDFDLEGRRRVIAISRFGVPRLPMKELTIQEGDIIHISVVRPDAAQLAEDLKSVGEPE
jgi:trk system potassium uptake protein TrkA